jgi:drug/metabolite transporter (DMT)-like permease
MIGNIFIGVFFVIGIALIVIGVNIHNENKYLCGDTEINNNTITTYSNLIITMGVLMIILCGVFYTRNIMSKI